MEIYPDHIPSEIQSLESFMFWKNIRKGDGKMTKSPVSSTGFRIAHNNTDELMPFESAKERLSETKLMWRRIRAIYGASTLMVSLSPIAIRLMMVLRSL